MTNHKNRLAKLETAGLGKRYPYLCVISTGWAEGMKDKEERAKGYKIQPYTPQLKGTGGEPFYLADIDALREFAQRPDVSITFVVVGDEDESPDPFFTDPYFAGLPEEQAEE
jgi:hypothetical protein